MNQHRGTDRHPRRKTGSILLTVAVATALMLLFWGSPSLVSSQLSGLLTLVVNSTDAMPPPGVEASDTPLGRAPVTAVSDNYSVMDSGDPLQPTVTYDPCRPIHYVIRRDNQPAGGEELIHQAVARVSAATSLQFVYDGETAEAPNDDRTLYQPEVYGERWAPVLIAWVTTAEQPEIAGDTVGFGGSWQVGLNSTPWVYVTGQVELDGPQMDGILAEPYGKHVARSIIMHEFGHLVGLDHVEDTSQLMHAESEEAWDFSDGDRAGLAQLGSGPCVPEL